MELAAETGGEHRRIIAVGAVAAISMSPVPGATMRADRPGGANRLGLGGAEATVVIVIVLGALALATLGIPDAGRILGSAAGCAAATVLALRGAPGALRRELASAVRA